MTFELNFLPASYIAALERGRARRRSFLFALVVLCAMVTTEGVLRVRTKGLRDTLLDAQRQAEVTSLRSDQTKQLHRRHQSSLKELEQWASPLRAGSASFVLDQVLAACPSSMVLQKVEWRTGGLFDANASPSLRIVGSMSRLNALGEFMEELEQGGRIPKLEVRRSGRWASNSSETMQEFVLQSRTDTEVSQ